MAAKALGVIRTVTNQVLIRLPPYDDRTIVKPASGWGDWPALTVKRRLIVLTRRTANLQ